MTFSVEAVREILARHHPIYRLHRPVYQAAMLNSLQRLWDPSFRRVLDVGGGTGIVAQAIHDLFEVDEVVSVDVESRFLPSLEIQTFSYDGKRLPFEDDRFDCVVFNNVIHHVRAHDRLPLLQECRRVASVGGILIKDHLAEGLVDRARLTALDIIGNWPFEGMIEADYMSSAAWRRLAEVAGYRVVGTASCAYRSGAMNWIFPNRLETTMRWDPVDSGLADEATAA